MADPILVKLMPGALHQEPDRITVAWQLPDGTRGEGSLDGLLEAHPGASLGLVISAADVQLTSVTLSRRQARHLQKVLPYLLEEQVLGEPESLWFAAGGQVDGRYPVVVCDRESLERLVGYLSSRGGALQGAAVDGQLLVKGAPLVVRDGEEMLLIADPDRLIALPAEQLAPTLEVLELSIDDWPRLDDPDDLFIALRAAWKQRLELLQGELRPRQERGGASPMRLLPPAWRSVAVFAGAALLAIWTLAWVQAWRYDRLADRQWAEAAALYESLFPGDRATGRLEAQFRSRLAQFGGGTGQPNSFSGLMAVVGPALGAGNAEGVSSRRIQFEQRDGVLLLDLEARAYEALEAVRERVEAAGLSAEIANFRNQGETVAARMKVGAG